MSNTRYLKIDKCFGCPHYGHSINGKEITTFCANPENMEIEPLPKFEFKFNEGPKYFPIITFDTIPIKEVEIPTWCKLPDTTTNKNVLLNDVKLAIMKHFQSVKEGSDLHYLHGLENAIEIIDGIK